MGEVWQGSPAVAAREKRVAGGEGWEVDGIVCIVRHLSMGADGWLNRGLVGYRFLILFRH